MGFPRDLLFSLTLNTGSQAREREGIPLVSLRAEPTPDTSSHGAEYIARDAGATISAEDSENPAALQSLRIEGRTSRGSSASSQAALLKICRCLSLKNMWMSVTRHTEGDGDDCDSAEVIPHVIYPYGTTDVPDYMTFIDLKLRVAVRKRNLAEVLRLLAEGVSLIHLHQGHTALHDCINEYKWNSLDEDTEDNQIIIKITEAMAVQTNAVNIPNDNEETPLYSAIEVGNLKLVEILVKAGAKMVDINGQRQSVLHAAAQCHHAMVFKYFLENHTIEILPDSDNCTPFHYAADLDHIQCMSLLLEKTEEQQKRTLLTSVNRYGRTPVHISAFAGYVELTMLLLRNGAALSVEGEKNTVIQSIKEGVPYPINFLKNLFDEFVTSTRSNDIMKDRVNVDYKVLATDRNQIKVLEDLVKYGYRKLLKHPLVESFIYLKWKCLLPVFITIIFSYLVFLVLFNIFIITTFIKQEERNNDTYSIYTENNDTYTIYTENNDTLQNVTRTMDKTLFVESYGWYPVIYIAIFILLAQEFMWIHLQSRRYFKRFESYVTISALLLVSIMPLVVSFAAPTPARHVACAAFLLVWLRPLFILSRIPGWGHYVLMLKIVAVNLSKIFAMLVWLVIGFALCFMIQYQLEKPFNNVGDAAIKTLVMMSSEFEYENLFGDTHAVNDADAFTAVIVRLLFVAFVILIATVMMNLMIGVAVSEINELASIGNIMALEMQVELLTHLEGVENLIFWKWWRKLSRIQYHHLMYNGPWDPENEWVVEVIDKLRYKETLDLKLHNDIYDYARKKEKSARYDEESNNSVVDTSTILDNRIKSLDDNNKKVMDANKEIIEAHKEVIEANKEIAATNKDIEKSINDLKKDVNMILELATSVMRLTRNRKVVSTKLKSRKRKK